MTSDIQQLWDNPPLVYRELSFKPHVKSCLINEPVDENGVDPRVGEQNDNQNGGGNGGGDRGACGNGGGAHGGSLPSKKNKGKGRVQGGWRK